MHKGPWGELGTLIEIDIDENDKTSEMKQKISALVDIPVEFLKLRLGAINQVPFCTPLPLNPKLKQLFMRVQESTKTIRMHKT